MYDLGVVENGEVTGSRVDEPWVWVRVREIDDGGEGWSRGVGFHSLGKFCL